MLCVIPAFTQDYDANQPVVSLKYRLSQARKVYMTIPSSGGDDYVRYAISCIRGYLTNLGVSVTTVKMDYIPESRDFGNAFVGKLQLPRFPVINDDNDYLIVGISFVETFALYSNTDIRVHVFFYDPKSMQKWYEQTSLKHTFKKAEKQLKHMFVDSLY